MRIATGITIRVAVALLAAATAACRASDDEVAGLTAQAQQLLDAGQPVQAQAVIASAVRERDDLPAPFLVQARVAVALGRRADAYRAYANAMALDAANPEALLGVAQTGLSTGHLDEAQDAANKVLALFPNRTDAMLVNGIGKIVRHDVDGALSEADKILETSPSDVGGIILKSRALAVRGDRAAALALLDKVASEQSRVPELAMARAELERQNGDGLTFLATLRRISELAPGNRDYRFDLIDMLYRLGQTQEARAEALRLINEQGAPSEEMERYSRLWYAYDPIALTPDQLANVEAEGPVDARLALARFYIATGRAPVAIALLRPIATGWSSEVQATLARALYASGNHAAGQAAANAVLRQDPDNSEALLVRADASLASGAPATAVVDYQRVVRDSPARNEGYLGLARAYAAANKPDGVRRAFEDGRSAMPQDLPLARAYFAWLLRTNDRAHALQVARRFALSSPSLVPAWRWYAAQCGTDSECREDATAGLSAAGRSFGLDPVPGTPRSISLIGRLE